MTRQEYDAKIAQCHSGSECYAVCREYIASLEERLERKPAYEYRYLTGFLMGLSGKEISISTEHLTDDEFAGNVSFDARVYFAKLEETKRERR